MSSSAEHARRGRVVRGELAEAARPAEPVLAGAAELEALAAELTADLRHGIASALGGSAIFEEPLEPAADPVATAREEGHAAGYAEGKAAALAEAEAIRARALAAAAEQLAAAARAVGSARQDLVTEVADDAVELTYALAAAILGDDLVATSLPPRDAVARALQLAPEGRDLVVRIPPSAELTAADLVGLYDTARISVLSDPSVEPGGCVVEAGACRIDTQISSALERVRRVLEEHHHSGDESPELVEEQGA